jgi:methylenetetrahydrofolate reductase (NADPH)
MKVTDLWKNGKPTLSFEFLPPKTEKAAALLEKTLGALPELRPDFVSVTFGAGGSTRDGSRELVERLIQEHGQNVVAYFACFGLGPDDIAGVLDTYKGLGVENVLLVRGDEPRDAEGFTPHPDSIAHASDLVAFARPRYDLCFGVAGYPEGHIDSESRGKDLEFLKMKIDNGAEFIITNYCYDNRLFFDFVERCRAVGITAPIVPGVMPIYSLKMMEMLAGICGASIPEAIRTGTAALPEGDTAALNNWGIEFAAEQCRDLLRQKVPGLHIYTMNRSSSVVGIVSRLRDEGFL